jgi:hypothetical protein
MKMRRLLIPILVAALLIGFGAVRLFANPREPQAPIQVPKQRTSVLPPASSQATTSTPSVGAVMASPSMIVVNTPTPVTITVQIAGPLIPNGVNLLRLGAAGTQPTIVGQLRGNGGGQYAIQQTFNETTTGQIQLEVSAAFQGQLMRTTSAVTQIGVGNVLNSTSSKFSVVYPPTLYVTAAPAPSVFFLESSPTGVAMGGGAPAFGSSEATTGFAVTISALPYTVSGSFDINQYLSTTYPNSAADVSAITPITIGGQPGYEFSFQDEEGGGQLIAVVYCNGYVYEIDYASTNNIPGFSDQEGLSAFNTVLQNFTFNQ